MQEEAGIENGWMEVRCHLLFSQNEFDCSGINLGCDFPIRMWILRSHQLKSAASTALLNKTTNCIKRRCPGGEEALRYLEQEREEEEEEGLVSQEGQKRGKNPELCRM